MSSGRFVLRLTALFGVIAAATPGCKGDDDSTTGQAGAAPCVNSGGPVEDGTEDMHCTDAQGAPIVQKIGKCTSGAAASAAGAAGAGDEEHSVLTSNHGADDDCKYDVSFTNSCIELNRPVTFTLTLAGRASGKPATGAAPEDAEIFLAADPSHISPSFAVKAPEKPPGTYTIGPIVFDRSGRWVVRFHFFETCSDVSDDSPHGHVAFYIDVP